MNYPVLITQQGETIAVAYDQSGIELAVQEHYVTPDNYLVGVGFMKAVFSDGLMCDLEEVEVYPAPKYNHAFDITFSLTSECPTGDTVTGAQLREALMQRLLNLTDDELVEAAGMPFDSYEEIQ